MAKLAIKKGSADVTVYLFAQDSSKTTGVGLTGLAYNTASLTAYYVRPLGSATQISLASLAAVDSAHTDGGFKEVDATNMPGVYRLDLPDAVCASGAPSAAVKADTAAILDDTGTSGVALAANAITDAKIATGAITSAKFASNAITSTVLADSAITANKIASNAIADAKIATDAFSAAKFKADAIAKIQNGLATPTNITGGTITTVTNLTNLPNAPADWLTASAVKSDAVTKIQNGLAAASDLSTANSNISSIKSKTDNLPASPAAVGSAMTLTSAYDAAKNAASQASVNAIPTTPLLAANYTAPDNAGIAGIKAKTDNLPATPAAKGDVPTQADIRTAVGLAAANLDTQLAGIQSDLDNPAQYKADVSGLAKTTDLNGLAKTTDLSGLATEANATSNKGAIITAIDNKPVTPVTDISTLATKTDVSGIPDALLSKVVVGTFTLHQILKIYAAIETGTVTGGGSASFTYTGKDGTTVTLSGVDENGNRTLVSVNFGA